MNERMKQPACGAATEGITSFHSKSVAFSIKTENQQVDPRKTALGTISIAVIASHQCLCKSNIQIAVLNKPLISRLLQHTQRFYVLNALSWTSVSLSLNTAELFHKESKTGIFS